MFVNQNYFCCDVTNFFCYDFLLSIYLVPYIHVYILVLSTLCHFDYSKYTILLGSTAFLIIILYDAIVWFFWFTLTFFNWYFLLSFFFLKRGGGCRIGSHYLIIVSTVLSLLLFIWSCVNELLCFFCEIKKISKECSWLYLIHSLSLFYLISVLLWGFFWGGGCLKREFCLLNYLYTGYVFFLLNSEFYVFYPSLSQNYYIIKSMHNNCFCLHT